MGTWWRSAIWSSVMVLSVFAGCGDDSSAPTGGTLPEVPGTVTVTPGDTQLTVEWAAVAGATSYEVYYHTADNSAAATRFTGDSDETDTVCTITGLSNGTLYYVWVKARNANGSSACSPGSSETPAVPVIAPRARARRRSHPATASLP